DHRARRVPRGGKYCFDVGRCCQRNVDRQAQQRAHALLLAIARCCIDRMTFRNLFALVDDLPVELLCQQQRLVLLADDIDAFDAFNLRHDFEEILAQHRGKYRSLLFRELWCQPLLRTAEFLYRKQNRFQPIKASRSRARRSLSSTLRITVGRITARISSALIAGTAASSALSTIMVPQTSR